MWKKSHSEFKVLFIGLYVRESITHLTLWLYTATLSLPPIQECFNSPYGTSFFSSYAEKIPGESTQMLSEAAKENEIYLVGGRTTLCGRRKTPCRVGAPFLAVTLCLAEVC